MIQIIKMLMMTAILVTIQGITSYAQVHLQLQLLERRTTWPEVQMDVRCVYRDEIVLPMQKSQYTLAVDGMNLEDFSVSCADTSTRNSFSAALLLDESGSMQTMGKTIAISGGEAIANEMDGNQDECSVIFFSSTVKKVQEFTNSKQEIIAAVNTLNPSGGSCPYDAIMMAMESINVSSNTPYKCVVAVTDGNDNASVSKAVDIVEYANANNINIYVIVIGSLYYSTYQWITDRTGGVCYVATSGYDSEVAIKKIAYMMHRKEQHCTISYKDDCMDGGEHTVVITAEDPSRGSDDLVSTYPVPYVENTFHNVKVKIEDVEGKSTNSLIVPVNIVPQDESSRYMLRSPEIEISFDNSLLEFVDVMMDDGMILKKATSLTNVNGNTIVISDTRDIDINKKETLCKLKYLVRYTDVDTATDIKVNSLNLERSCLDIDYEDAKITISPIQMPRIDIASGLPACYGDTVLLTASPGFAQYKWTNGQTNQSILVHRGGSYAVTVTTITGDTIESDSVDVFFYPENILGIAPSATVKMCKGTGTKLFADTGYYDYHWSNGETGRTVFIRDTGTYTVAAKDGNGCIVKSIPVQVTLYESPRPAIVGKRELCANDKHQWYSISGTPTNTYEWTTIGGTIISNVDSSAVYVQWDERDERKIIVRESNPSTGCSASDTMEVEMIQMNQVVQVTGSNVLCYGEHATLDAGEGYDTYLWNTGEMTRKIEVRMTGEYYCHLTMGTCNAFTDTVSVTVAPEIPVSISGNAIVCRNAKIEYETQTVSGAHYSWSIDGGIIAHGNGTSKIAVEWDDTSNGKITLGVERDACMAYDTLYVQLLEPPKPVISLHGTIEICEGDSLWIYAESGYATYEWSTGESTHGIFVTKEGAYSIAVTGINGCIGRSDTLYVAFFPETSEYGIVMQGNMLQSKATGKEYRWYKDGQRLNDSTRTIIPIGGGTYTVFVVDWNGCQHASEPFTISGTGQYAPSLTKSFILSPNPTDGKVEVLLEFEKPSLFSWRLVNMLGKTIRMESAQTAQITYKQNVSLSDQLPGVYFFLLQSEQGWDCRKIILQK